MYSATSIEILKFLARHKFLSRAHFTELGLGVSRNHFTHLMKGLTDEKMKFVGQKKFGYNPRYGKVADIYFLRTKGKNYLIKEHGRQKEEIHLPLWSKLFYSDYDHRIKTIDIRIRMERELANAGMQILFYDTYFTGRAVDWKRGRQVSTKIMTEHAFLNADSIILCFDEDFKQYLFCLEYHNGEEVKRIEQQMRMYASSIKIGSASQKYDVAVGSRVLNVFRKRSVMERTIERMQNDVVYTNMMDYFLFITLEDFERCWIGSEWRSATNIQGSVFWRLGK